MARWLSTTTFRNARCNASFRSEQLLPKHPMAETVNYALGQWTELNVFCSDGAVAIDNNVSEREMKRVVQIGTVAAKASHGRNGELCPGPVDGTERLLL